MELRQLVYFLAVAEEGSFTRAALRVHVAQPGVSAQIRRLERELGQELLDRSGRAVRLTEAGAAVLPYARAALEAVSGARQAVDELRGLVRGRVAVGMVTAGPGFWVPGLLADFHRAHPGVEITLSEANSDQLAESVRTGTLDLAVLGVGAAPLPGLDRQIIVDEEIVAVVTHEDPLAAKKTVTLAAIADRPLISLPRGTGLRARVDEAFAAAGVPSRVTFEAGDPTVLAQLAGQGLGMAFLPASLARSHPELHALRVSGRRLRGRLALAWRRTGGVSPAARALIHTARTTLPDLSRGVQRDNGT
ncbi:MAG TPA: LysR substrate-binding domain-containing protein [Pseudonocardiaceae bacterium]|jgi:DNA-binding transcriptional LysR family regulator|nr:LysR substrate-binding domain-containing protein [Pseudonocardiaceae bacterium]